MLKKLQKILIDLISRLIEPEESCPACGTPNSSKGLSSEEQRQCWKADIKVAKCTSCYKPIIEE